MRPDTSKKEKVSGKRKWLRRLRNLSIVLASLILLFITWFYFITRVHPPDCSETAITKMQRVSPAPGVWVHGNSILRSNPDGLYEMYLEGNPYELGYTHGSLTKELNLFQEESFVSQIRLLIPSTFILNKLKYFIGFFNRNLEDHIRDDYRREIFGVSRFASDYFDFIAEKYQRILNYHAAHDIGHAVQDKNLTAGCTSFIIRGKKTADGHMLLGRNFDFYSGDSFAKNKIVCFIHPDHGNDYAFVTWPGFTGVVSGMNTKGLAVTINAAKSTIPSGSATPISILVKEILQYASNLDEAIGIAKKRQTFVSESILIASAADRNALIIEKSPDKSGLVYMRGDVLVCSNHYQSKTFKNDDFNLKNIRESSSEYRRLRMTELLSAKDSMDPEDAINVLRDRFGKNGKDIGMGNEKCINQLICHHGVVMDPENLRIYVSTNPFNLGQVIGYDLRTAFQKKLKDNSARVDNISSDPFIQTQAFADYLSFRRLILTSVSDIKFNPETPKLLVTLNPTYFHAWKTAGDYCFRFHKFAEALTYYQKALDLEIATVPERKAILEGIKSCKEKIRSTP